ncbi:hypothetical protein HMI56_006737 [Coelomomyces lativittatus]|nr:hypothetical protein HMI56_006737 [Coelomomyces lativittatus]
MPWSKYPKWVMTSLRKAMTQLYQSGGFLSFWRGNGMNCIKIIPESGTKFMVFEAMKHFFSSPSPSTSTSPFFSKGHPLSSSNLTLFLSGALAGCCSQALVYPLETLKTHWMAAHPSPMSFFQHSQTIYQQYGLQGFFRGFKVSMLGIVPYAGLELGIFDVFKTHHVHATGQPASGSRLLGMGIVSGCLACTLVYPMSLVRTRLQAQGTLAHPQYYHQGAWQVIQMTYQRESMLGFYKGWLPTLMKVAPASGLSYMCYETLKQGFLEWDREEE